MKYLMIIAGDCPQVLGYGTVLHLCAQLLRHDGEAGNYRPTEEAQVYTEPSAPGRSSSSEGRDEDPVLAKKPDPGLCTSNEGRFL